ncbi:sulfotransferase domain-containing protein [uncultured Altibacter sp.]|uniref:sulfotransferase domain-containing protein n=1 Tax=uncultured Altibacter sp. TaxID=2506933 RepID=UPI0030D9B087
MQLFKKNKTIIHCCTQKTASQWFISFLSDVIAKSNKNYKIHTFVDYRESVIFKDSIYKKPSYSLQKDLYTEQEADFGFNRLKKNCFYTSFYIGPNILNYLSAKDAKVFFVLRDPRDLVVSWYYSAKYSHPPTEQINIVRSKLVDYSFDDGIKYSIDEMNKFGLFEGVKRWMTQKEDHLVRIYLYEDFVEHYTTFCLDLLSFLELKKKNVLYDDIINKHSYKNYSSGRKKGESNNKSHYRSASVDQWKNELNEELIEYFELKTNNLGAYYDSQKDNFKKVEQ